MTPQAADTAIAIFAKYPRPGQVKTRLAGAPTPGHRQLSHEDCAALYEAFLRDYQQRFSAQALAGLQAQGCFCLRPGPDATRFREQFGDGALALLEEPSLQGQPAADIGQAMGYTIRGLLAAGFRKVVLLGSDLPHVPMSMLQEAIAALDRVPLVLGNDGGGCYLVAATTPTPLLEDGQIPWSEGRDFEAICAAQRAAGGALAVLSAQVEDIDTPDALARLTAALASGQIEAGLIPHTRALLEAWGWIRST